MREKSLPAFGAALLALGTLDPAGAEPRWAGDFAHSVSPIHAILE